MGIRRMKRGAEGTNLPCVNALQAHRFGFLYFVDVGEGLEKCTLFVFTA